MSTAPDIFEQDAERLEDAADGRRERRVSLRLPLYFRLPDGRRRPGVLADLSVRGAAVIAPPAAILRDEVVLEVPDLGTLQGKVRRLTDKGFGITLTGTKSERIARADALTVFLNRPSEADRPVRFPTREQAVLTTADGFSVQCVILDISGTGASIATALFPSIGATVRIGRKKGVVTRHHAEGIGISFPPPRYKA
ncbi:hypothetical protein HK107_03850 [Parvularcula sp. ZS-1/3]|uniref:PilZ domain-containing protein n=1 Tax=Parvularcula mediterranea TaxID=2732508 RepID=A0A7Y3RJY8_9PROT|nr:PilZ domain-containing protein [Parvularcula mediterranea]NNU15454.1 hypothetical protein [Parvularcula mediterranea]